MLKNRSYYYSLYKKLTKKTSYNNVRYPKGNYNFWKSAVESEYKIETDRIIKAVEDIFKGKRAKININFKLKKYGETDEERKERIIGAIIDGYNNKPIVAKNKLVLSQIQKGSKTYYTLNDHNISVILNKLKMGPIPVYSTGSDSEIIDMLYNGTKISLFGLNGQTIRNAIKRKKLKGAFLPYLCDKKYYNNNWKKYGIYSELKDIEKVDNCFIVALKNSGKVTEYILNSIRVLVRNQNIPKNKLDKICKKYNLNIKLSVIYDEKKTNIKITHYNKNSTSELIEIALYKGHYFLYDRETDIKPYALKNIKEVYKISDRWNLITKKSNGKYKYETKRDNINSFQLIDNLIKQDILKPIDNTTLNLYNTIYYNNQNIKNEYKNLNYPPSDAILYYQMFDNDNLKTNIFFDIESYINENKKFVPYCVSFIIDEEYKESNGEKGKYIIKGLNCVNKMLTFLTIKLDKNIENYNFIAHNLGFDFRQIIDEVYNVKALEMGRSIINCSCIFFNKENNKHYNLYFKDSYKLMPFPLSKFKQIFNLTDVKKEIITHQIYNIYTMRKTKIKITKAIKYMKEEGKTDKDIEEFILNIDKWGLRVNNKSFKHIDYSARYCLYDTETLLRGYNLWREWMLKYCDIDINVMNTLGAIAKRYIENNNCLDGVCYLSNIPYKFIYNSVVGGRVMTNQNKKYIVNEKLQDFDAVGLYPSAMYSFDGFIKGEPKVINNENLNMEFLNKTTHYFIEIEILKVNKKREFPLLSIIEDNCRNFTNNIIGHKFIVDKYCLEDLIKYQQIEYKIIKGYYFDEGYNKEINKCIEKLLKIRNQLKNEGNPAQTAIKQIMNSIYGKTIEKERGTEKKYFNTKKSALKYICRHNEIANEFYKIGKYKYCVKIAKPINNHYGFPHIGSSILSYSKRIMNNVICTAEDIGIKIYYQDTDSIHIKDSDIPKLEKTYNELFKTELIGKNFGQFHSDFEAPIDNDNDYIKNLVSVKSVFLGKKSYYDYLQYDYYKYDEETKTHNKEIRNSHHIRMKGIPSQCIKKVYKNPYDCYKDLYNGEEIKFDLIKDGGRAFFEYKNNFDISLKNEFTRNLKFV